MRGARCDEPDRNQGRALHRMEGTLSISQLMRRPPLGAKPREDDAWRRSHWPTVGATTGQVVGAPP